MHEGSAHVTNILWFVLYGYPDNGLSVNAIRKPVRDEFQNESLFVLTGINAKSDSENVSRDRIRSKPRNSKSPYHFAAIQLE